MGCRRAIGDAGVEARILASAQPALFLDRDGVVNVERGYAYRAEEIAFVDGLFQLCRSAVQRDYQVVVITNQAGIGRGYYTEDDFRLLTHWMLAEFNSEGIPGVCFYYCPHHPSAGVGPYRVECPSRKPDPGMLLAARDDHRLDLGASILIGDKASDIEAGHRAGVGTLVLLGAGASPGAAKFGSLVVSTLAEARARLFGSPDDARGSPRAG